MVDQPSGGLQDSPSIWHTRAGPLKFLDGLSPFQDPILPPELIKHPARTGIEQSCICGFDEEPGYCVAGIQYNRVDIDWITFYTPESTPHSDQAGFRVHLWGKLTKFTAWGHGFPSSQMPDLFRKALFLTDLEHIDLGFLKIRGR